uniref:PDZ domain-containing protein n=1 Tax=Macrostomum lignano TaxID=282301 RepID=A0A1I8FB13_9PLAT
LNTEWTELEVIDLLNDGSGLGFGIVGSKSTGVVVRTILSGGAADRDGRLRSGDHILSVGTVCTRGMASEHVASLLRQCSDQPDGEPGRLCQLTPTAELDAHLADLLATMQPQLNDEEAMAEAEQQDSRTQTSWPQNCLEQFHKPPQLSNSRNSAEENSEEDFENEEEKHFTVLLNRHGSRGGSASPLRGYVGECPLAKLSGIFIKSILSGSEADIQGRLAMNDRIVKVNGSSLEGCSNHAAVELLRSCGSRVRLRLVRYKSGHVHHQLMAHT